MIPSSRKGRAIAHVIQLMAFLGVITAFYVAMGNAQEENGKGEEEQGEGVN